MTLYPESLGNPLLDLAVGGSPAGPQRIPMYRPAERAQIEALIAGLQSGADPSAAMSLFGAVQGSALDRLAAAQQRAQMRQEQMQQLPNMLGQAAELQAAGVPQGALESAYSGYGGQVGSHIQDMIGGLYAGGGVQSLDQETIAALWSEGAAAPVATVENPVPRSFDQVITQNLGLLEAQGYGPEALDQAYKILHDSYSSAGGQVPASGSRPLASGTAQVPIQRNQGMLIPGVRQTQEVLERENPYTRSWQPQQQGVLEDVISAPRSLFDDILAVLGG